MPGRKITAHVVLAIASLRRRGASVKEIAADLELGERTIRRALTAYRRTAPTRQSSSIPWRAPRKCALLTIKGQGRLHFAERVLDLQELCRLAVLDPPVTIATLMRILHLEEASAVHAFYAMRDQFEPFGLVLEKDAAPGVAQVDALIVFDREKAEAFVKRELPEAEKLLTEWKTKRGTHERFRGRKAT